MFEQNSLEEIFAIEIKSKFIEISLKLETAILWRQDFNIREGVTLENKT